MLFFELIKAISNLIAAYAGHQVDQERIEKMGQADERAEVRIHETKAPNENAASTTTH